MWSNNPSVSYADSSLYTREPLVLGSRLYSLYKKIIEIWRKGKNMKNPEKLLYVLSIVLTIIYIPISFFSFLLGMLSEVVMDTANQVIIGLIDFSSCIAMLVPVFCFVGILLSIRCRKKGYIVWSFVLQFLPLAIFCVNLLFIHLVDVSIATL